jgi:hypothetical protein
MAIWEDLIRSELGELAIEAKKRLIRQLTELGREFLVPQVADAVSRIITKSLDGVVKAAVTSLEMEDDAARLCSAYLAEVQDQFDEFQAALESYLPLAIAVEVAKKKHGASSSEANEARRTRAVFLAECRAETRDIFAAVVGKETGD